MPNVTISVPRELRDLMRKRPDVNWSQICREAIRNYLEGMTMAQLATAIKGLPERMTLLETRMDDVENQMKVIFHLLGRGSEEK